MINDSGTVQDRKIYELTDIYDERNGYVHSLPEEENSHQVIVVDGRGYERAKNDGHKIHELTDVIEEDPSIKQFNEEVMKRAMELIEKIAREAVPDIAERVIREEIEKIKGMGKKHTTTQD
jgi:predicted RNase H-like HicB family nuclease